MRDTIDLAREAGATVEVGMAPVFNTHAELKAFEALVRADEREACAQLCEDAPEPDGYDLAERIRERKNT
jgi:hypothetical protein